MEQIKLFSFDLDGTLLNNHKEISDYTIEKLIDLEKQGYQIILGSGRYFKEIKRFADALELEKYHGYAVCGNGYEVIDIQNDTHKTFELIDKEIAKECVLLANQLGLYQYIKINGTYHLSTNKVEKMAMNGVTKLFHLLAKSGVKQLSYSSHLLDESIFEQDLGLFIEDGLVKLCVIGTPKAQRKWVHLLNEKYPKYFAFYPVNPYALEITHKSVSKKNGVEYVAKLNGYSLENVMAFGDSGNDEPLLLNAGIGVTMKNGTKRALKKARLVSDYTNHEDGVIKMIEKLIGESK